MDYENEEQYRGPPTPVAATITANIDADHLVAAVALEIVGKVRSDIDAKVEDGIAEAIEQTLGGAIATKVTERLATAVDEVLTQGIARTDDYGRALPAKTVKDLVGDELARRSDNYSGRGAETLVQRALREATEREVAKMVTVEIEAARVAFRAQVDALLQAKLAETLRNALGLK